MALEPLAYLNRPLPDLFHALARAGSGDLPPGGEVQLFGPVLRAVGRAGAAALDSGRPPTTVTEDTRLPLDHPPVEVPGVVLESFLGGGGQGLVYAGRVQSTGKLVAVKVLARKSGDPFTWGAREAILAARVRHPNLLRVLRAQPVGKFWVVLMELVQGEELAPGRLPAERARSCFGQLADALRELAAQRLVHRDVKPANILLRQQDGSPVLVDFGLAVDLTEPGRIDPEFSGTPFYVAPEAWRDLPPDPSWDAYSLGVTAAVVLTGPPPSGSDMPSLRLAKLTGAFDRTIGQALDGIADEGLRAWVAGLIDADPARRKAALAAATSWQC